MPENGRQLQPLPAQTDLAPGDAGHVEQVFDQPGHVLDLPAHHAPRGLDRGGAGVVGLQQVRGVAQGGQRVAQLVGQQGQELVLAAIGRGQLPDAMGQGGFQLPARRDVLHRQQGQRVLPALPKEPPGVEQHGLPADVLEIVLHLVALEPVVPRPHLLQEPAQLGDVPLTVAEIVEEAALRFFGRLLEEAIERLTRGHHAQPRVQHQERLPHRGHDALGIFAGTPQRVDVDQHDHRAVDLVLQGLVGPDAQRVPPPSLVLNFVFPDAGRVEHLGQQRLQVGDAEVEPDVRDRPADVGGDQVEDLFRHRREAPDAQVLPDDDDGRLDAAEEVEQVVVEQAQLRVAVLQLVVDRGQLFVARLDLLLGGLQLFVEALQLLVGRLRLLIGGLQLFVGALLLLDHRLQVVARRGQLLRQTGILPLGGLFPGGGPGLGFRGLAPASLSSRVSWRESGGDGLLEKDQEARFPRRASLDGDHLQMALPGFAV